MRQLMSMKQDPNAENSILDFCAGDLFADIDQCEGLTFGGQPEFEDPTTKIKYPYAFKLDAEKVRLLIMVKCNVSFKNYFHNDCFSRLMELHSSIASFKLLDSILQCLERCHRSKILISPSYSTWIELFPATLNLSSSATLLQRKFPTDRDAKFNRLKLFEWNDPIWLGLRICALLVLLAAPTLSITILWSEIFGSSMSIHVHFKLLTIMYEYFTCLIIVFRK